MKVKFTFKKANGRKNYEILEVPEKSLFEYIQKENLKKDSLILGEKYLNSYLTKVEDAD